jgi:hypothetical protein
MTTKVKFGFTDHAVQRFIQRVAPNLSFEEARTILVASQDNATFLKEKTRSGQNMWLVSLPNYEFRLITKIQKVNERYVVVSILPAEWVTNGKSRLHEEQFRNGLLEGVESTLNDRVFKIEHILKDYSNSEIKQVLSLEVAILREETKALHKLIGLRASEERTARVKLTLDSQNTLHKACLRVALRALHGEISNEDALQVIRSLDSTLDTPAFLSVPVE